MEGNKLSDNIAVKLNNLLASDQRTELESYYKKDHTISLVKMAFNVSQMFWEKSTWIF